MADYFPIPDTMVDPDAPLLSDLAYAWRDNPLAIAEGSAGAPKVQGTALGGVWLGFKALGNTYTSTYSILSGTIKSLELRCYTVTSGSPAASVLMSISSDGGSTWSSGVTLFTPSASATISITNLDLTTGSWINMSFENNQVSTGTHSVTSSSCNAVRFATSRGVPTGAYTSLYVLGGN